MQQWHMPGLLPDVLVAAALATSSALAGAQNPTCGACRVLQHQAPEVATSRRRLRSVAGGPAPPAAKPGAGAAGRKRGRGEPDGSASRSGEASASEEDDEEDAVVLEGKRRRSAVDYRWGAPSHQVLRTGPLILALCLACTAAPLCIAASVSVQFRNFCRMLSGSGYPHHCDVLVQ